MEITALFRQPSFQESMQRLLALIDICDAHMQHIYSLISREMIVVGSRPFSVAECERLGQLGQQKFVNQIHTAKPLLQL